MNPLNINIEEHPLEPFLPHNARLLMLGSFPPQRKRWCMEFYYPNFINDMWRIVGHVFFDDKHHFVDEKNKCFKKDCLIDFLNEKGIALFDTATAIRRLQDNASDKFLEVITPTDVPLLLKQIPHCKAIATTGQKATDIICETFNIHQPAIGSYCSFVVDEKTVRLYRMPSSSRAYPMKLEKKSDFYRKMWEEVGIL
jgi:G:T/U-mismatch repair DNA glycosylase